MCPLNTSQTHLLLMLGSQGLQLCPVALQCRLSRILCTAPLVSQGCLVLLPKCRKLLLILRLDLQGGWMGARGTNCGQTGECTSRVLWK